MPAVSKKQQHFMGMVRAYQKGELKDAPASVRKAAKSMSEKDVKKFASTPTDDLPNTVKEYGLPTFKEYLVVEALLSQVDEWKVEQDEDGLIHLIDGEGTIRASMPAQIWRALCARSNDPSLNEGVFDAVRGASVEAGKKLASVPRQVAQSTKNAYATHQRARNKAEMKQFVDFVSNTYAQLHKLDPNAESLFKKFLAKHGENGLLAIKKYELMTRTMRNPLHKEDAKAERKEQRRQQPKQLKWPKLQTASEGVGDFLKGAAHHAASGVIDDLNARSRTAQDFIDAGKQGSKINQIEKLGKQMLRFIQLMGLSKQQSQQGK